MRISDWSSDVCSSDLLQVLEVLHRRGIGLREALRGLQKVPQTTVNVRCSNGARPAEADSVKAALATAQAGVAGRGRAFLRPSGTEPVVRVTVEADDDALVQSPLADGESTRRNSS